jgi:hypothetical protein
MLPSAVEKAKFHFQRAKGAFASIPNIFEGDFSNEWANFLNAGNSVYEALAKGSKATPQSRQWFGAKKRERRTDPLLNYMHQARNAAEHGLNELLLLGPTPRGRDAIALHAGKSWDTCQNREGVSAIFTNADGSTARVQLTPPDWRLRPVYDDRSDAWTDPPNAHLGKTLRSQTPVAVGLKWMAYLKRMIAEAESFTSDD